MGFVLVIISLVLLVDYLLTQRKKNLGKLQQKNEACAHLK